MRRAQHAAERRRAQLGEEGVHVPPFMILSVTGRCNLACAGCYAQAQERQEESDMTSSELLSVVRQGSDLGVGIMLLAGGEPMTRADDLLTIAHDVPDVVFPVFTNGTLLDESLVAPHPRAAQPRPCHQSRGTCGGNRRTEGRRCRRAGAGGHREDAQGRRLLRDFADSHPTEHRHSAR